MFFVVLDSMFLEESYKFIAEALMFVVFFLVANVSTDYIQLRNAHAERAVFVLPGGESLIGKCVMNPFGGAALN